MSVPEDQIRQLMARLMGGTPEPGQAERINQLRRQQAVGVLGTMGGKNVAPSGQNLYASATTQLDDLEGTKGLDQAVKQIQGLKGLRELTVPEATKGWSTTKDEFGNVWGVNPGTGEKRLMIGGGPGGGAATEKAPTGEAKVQEQVARYHLGRILDTAETLEAKVEEAGKGVQKPGATEAMMRAWGMPGAANLFSSADRQVVWQSQIDMLDSLLYLATGAAYNNFQLAGMLESYVPSFTDTQPAVEAKRDRLKRRVEDAQIRAGKAMKPADVERIVNLFSVDAAPKGSAPPGSTRSALPGATGQNDVIDLPPRR